MSLTPEKDNEKLEPQTEKARYPCPFYGFHTALGLLIDQTGNQCALITTSYSPCQMEINGQTPDFNLCQFNNPDEMKKLEQMAAQVRVFPREFGPNGLSINDWKEYIRARKPY